MFGIGMGGGQFDGPAIGIGISVSLRTYGVGATVPPPVATPIQTEALTTIHTENGTTALNTEA